MTSSGCKCRSTSCRKASSEECGCNTGSCAFEYPPEIIFGHHAEGIHHLFGSSTFKNKEVEEFGFGTGHTCTDDQVLYILLTNHEYCPFATEDRLFTAVPVVDHFVDHVCTVAIVFAASCARFIRDEF